MSDSNLQEQPYCHMANCLVCLVSFQHMHIPHIQHFQNFSHETDHAEHNGNAVMAQLTLYISGTAVGVLTCTSFRLTADSIAQGADVKVNLWEASLKIATQQQTVCLSVCKGSLQQPSVPSSTRQTAQGRLELVHF